MKLYKRYKISQLAKQVEDEFTDELELIKFYEKVDNAVRETTNGFSSIVVEDEFEDEEIIDENIIEIPDDTFDLGIEKTRVLFSFTSSMESEILELKERIARAVEEKVFTAFEDGDWVEAETLNKAYNRTVEHIVDWDMCDLVGYYHADCFVEISEKENITEFGW